MITHLEVVRSRPFDAVGGREGRRGCGATGPVHAKTHSKSTSTFGRKVGIGGRGGRSGLGGVSAEAGCFGGKARIGRG
jgi:hypothetical protein